MYYEIFSHLVKKRRLDHLGQLQQTGNCKNNQRYFEGPYFWKHQRCQEYEKHYIEHPAQMIVHQLAARNGVAFCCQAEGEEEQLLVAGCWLLVASLTSEF